MGQKTDCANQAQKLHSSIKIMEDTIHQIQPELEQMEKRRAALEEELAVLNTKISSHKAQLTGLPNSIDLSKREFLAKHEEYQSIKAKLECVPGTDEDDKQQLTKVESIRTTAVNIIKQFLNL